MSTNTGEPPKWWKDSLEEDLIAALEGNLDFLAQFQPTYEPSGPPLDEIQQPAPFSKAFDPFQDPSLNSKLATKPQTRRTHKLPPSITSIPFVLNPKQIRRIELRRVVRVANTVLTTPQHARLELEDDAMDTSPT